MTYVIINEQHTLLAEQEMMLIQYFGHDWQIIKVPAAGWTLSQIVSQLGATIKSSWFVFVSPIPAMMILAARRGFGVMCFHNDAREKVELPDGKIISVVAKKGWMLV